MQLDNMVITDDLIRQAEKLLLPPSCVFDDERKDFIKWLDSGDLMAVPGSGKTTVLQAKLYCIAKQLPLEGGKGILVLSHTNTAVDELKKLLQKPCPQLFEYPNFVGTIQQFVDKYLAIPIYVNSQKKKIEVIDAERYEKYIEGSLVSIARHDSYTFHQLENKYKHIKDIRFDIDKDGNCRLLEKFGGEDLESKIEVSHKGGRDGIRIRNEVLRKIADVKMRIYKDGVLHFDDCYFLAKAYCLKHQQIVDIISHRFRYVFVDEAQDMMAHQLELLDLFFYNKEHVTFQRIGDPNQSIFNGFSTSGVIWTCRNEKYLKKSFRLSQENAVIVDHLILNRYTTSEISGEGFQVEGKRVNSKSIKPHLLLYKDNQSGQLKEKFKNLIIEFELPKTEESKYGYHIIGWAARSKGEPGKQHLEDVFPEYTYQIAISVTREDSLNRVVQNSKLINDFAGSRRAVLESICRVLFLMGLRNHEGLRFTPTRLEGEINDQPEKIREDFHVGLLDCTMKLAGGDWKNGYELVKRLISNTIGVFTTLSLNDGANTFIGTKFESLPMGVVVDSDDDDIPIQIGTVHSVKGMTHCATMYVDTYFNGKYESEYLVKKEAEGWGSLRKETLKSPFFGDDVKTTGVYDSMAKRMVYVGFSRPTHLLCYASEKKRWSDEAIEKAKDAGWKVCILS